MSDSPDSHADGQIICNLDALILCEQKPKSFEITVVDSPYLLKQKQQAEAEKSLPSNLPPKPRPKPPTIAILELIKKCESGGNYTAQNRYSTASGVYQFIDSTWNNYGGYAKAKYAPPEIQDAKARETYARSGTIPWNASRHCWGR